MRMANNHILSNDCANENSVYQKSLSLRAGLLRGLEYYPTIYHVVADRIRHSDAAPSERRREGSDSRNCS